MALYWEATRKSLILLYLDQTIIQTSIAISKVAVIDFWAVFIAIPFLFLIVLAGRLLFTTLNKHSQTTLLYRAKYSSFFLYDQHYHLNYIDHLFDQQNIRKDRTALKKPFFPESNLIIMEIIFKFLLSVSTVLFYEYSPYLFAYLCVFILVFFMYLMDHLFSYEKSTLIFHIACLLTHIYALSTFFKSSLFTYFISLFSVASLVLIVIFEAIIINSWRSNKEGEMFMKVY